MAMSLVLLVADVQNDIHLGAVVFFVHAPFTITMVLWIVWGYWLWRYYTSFHDIGEKGFMPKYRERLQRLVERIGVRRIIQGDREQYKEIHEKLLQQNPNGTRNLMVFLSNYAAGSPSASHLSLNLSLGLKDPDGILATEALNPPEYAVTVDGIQFFFIAARAWVYVIFRTTLFSEYLLPFFFAFAVAGYGVYVHTRTS